MIIIYAINENILFVESKLVFCWIKILFVKWKYCIRWIKIIDLLNEINLFNFATCNEPYEIVYNTTSRNYTCDNA